ncbi:hypothetical protein [Robertmurraya andreesenii]|uniref:Uncharacterized protein n=1 Tax=Anoxybacillus andreesenii TaxID=1325932 RepID=A0ABT9V5S1_9BACL|nr:hypothetical protein [Robertmurraya andreesenii]MDQ0156294.1 hypothetical protein [Robertmurraya andreesenii]
MYFLPQKISITGIKVNNEDHLSSISISSTRKINRNVCAKKNQGIGQQFADGCLRMYTVSAVFDEDREDSISIKRNI